MGPERLGLLIDLDGTIILAGARIEGARRAMARLRELEVPVLYTTNTSRKSRRAVVESLAAVDLHVDPGQILTAPIAAARWLEREGIRRVRLLLPRSTHEDFDPFEIDVPEPEAVVVGDLGEGFTFDVLNEAFRALREGARLVAVHKNRYWLPAAGPTLDAGPFVVGLEYAARVEATLVGKPAPAFFDLAAEMLGVPRDGLAVVGDDLESDVRGARTAGLIAIQVQTGKFDRRATAEADPDERPHAILPSIAALPDWLERATTPSDQVVGGSPPSSARSDGT